MLFLKRKTTAKPNAKWDQSKWQYDDAIYRCYKWNTVNLALCGATKVVGFNVPFGDEHLWTGKRCAFFDDSCKMYGVVYEEGDDSKHVQCEVEFVNAPRNEERVGHLTLTHLLESSPRPEEKPLELLVTLCDSTLDLRKCLQESLRDAALSGYRFINVKLGCQETSDEELKNAVSEMHEKGYGPQRKIVDIMLWPSIELEHSPKWARQKR